MTQIIKDADPIVGVQNNFSVFIPPPKSNPNGDDFHLIKETVVYASGATAPRVRFRKNFERDFYITKPTYQNHKAKKEFEDIDKQQPATNNQKEET